MSDEEFADMILKALSHTTAHDVAACLLHSTSDQDVWDWSFGKNLPTHAGFRQYVKAAVEQLIELKISERAPTEVEALPIIRRDGDWSY